MERRLPMDIDPNETFGSTLRSTSTRVAVADLLAGRTERLEVGRVIGRGAMGTVYAGTQKPLGREVAIKAPKRNEADVHALLQEAWVGGLLEHPNIVPVHDIEVIGGVPHVVMKRIEGVVWSKLINNPSELLNRFGRADHTTWNIEVLIAVCNAIEYAHHHGILHRDLKPSNVMIGTYGEVWVLDWGLAVSLSDRHADRLPLARDQCEIAGTPAYMAPEMVEADGDKLTERTDIYLLAGLLYRHVMGVSPHPGSEMEAVYKALFEPVEIDPEAPFADLLTRCLHADPEERPESVAAFRGELQNALFRRGANALIADTLVKLADLETLAADTEPEDPESHRFALYDLYGACRFGFEEAMERIATPEAREGLSRATRTMVEFELDHADPRSARLLLQRSPVPDEALTQRIALLESEQAAEEARLRELDADNDPRTAWWARFVVVSSVGALWTFTPLVTGLLGFTEGYGRELSIAVVTFVGTLGMLGMLAPWVLKSRINRFLLTLVVVAPGLAIPINIGGWLHGLDAATSGTLEMFANFELALLGAIFGDWRLAPSVVVYLVCFLVAMAVPGTTLPLLALANILLAINMIATFLPLARRPE